jgi:lipoate-protein ligase A
VAALDAIVAPALAPAELLGLELDLLGAVAASEAPPTLVVHTLRGRLVSIGRYHLYDGPGERDGVQVWRRLTGGRVAGSGDGWLGLAMILPRPAALTRDEPQGLRPEQVMNRHVRPTLAALRAQGLECFYPGRDALTRERREIAMCTFERDAAGAVLFELFLAVSRGMEDAVRDLEVIDPDGQLNVSLYHAENSTTVERERGARAGPDAVQRAMIDAYGATAGGVAARALSNGELAAGRRRGAESAGAGWLGRSPLAAGRIAYGRLAGQLGTVEARIALDADETIAAVQLSGDVIANSPGISRLEEELRGQQLELGSIARAVTRTYESGDNFILGIGTLDNLVRLLASAQ